MTGLEAVAVWLVFGAVSVGSMVALARFMDRRGYGDE